MKIGKGIFTWNAMERRSRRYGTFYLNDQNYEGDVHCSLDYNVPLINSLFGKRIKLTAIVKEVRTSGHAGDLLFDPPIKPSTPQVGDQIVVGIGLFFLKPEDSPSLFAIGLKPSDGRDRCWFDPRIFYHLHDQTVELMAEESSEPDLPDCGLRDSDKTGLISNGDGTFQIVGVRNPSNVKPKILERTEDGVLFKMPSADVEGESFDVSYEQE